MLSNTIISFALVGAVVAVTPPGFEPAASESLTVAFGSVLATDGKDIPRADTASAPTLGTANKLFGTYAVMMVDPDLPPSTGSTNELLHWMQAGLTSSDTVTTVAGVQVHELVNTANEPALASYIQPSPPNRAPLSHRYTQLLLNTTGNSSVLTTLQTFAKTRTNFSAVDVVRSAGLTVLFGNSFNVTNSGSNSTAQANATSTTARPTGTGTSTNSTRGNTTTTSGLPKATGGADSAKNGGAFIAGLGAMAAAMALL